MPRRPYPQCCRGGEADSAADDDTGAQSRDGGDGGKDDRADACPGVGQLTPHAEEGGTPDRGGDVGAEGHDDAGADAVAEAHDHRG
jgi:hypothetical protein